MGYTQKSMVTAVLLFFLLSLQHNIAFSNEQLPNVIIFYADDLGYGDLASYGHPIVKTPNIDQLANEGVKYTQFYSPAPLCSPSRAGLLTGRTPYRTGIRSWIPKGKDVYLSEHEITIAHLLKEKGYATFIAGKLHLNGGIEMEDHPQVDDMGFDYAFIMHGGWAKNSKVEESNQEDTPRYGKLYPDNFYRNGEAVGATTKFSGELVADETIAWLSEHDFSKPVFAYIPFSEVHTPVASPQKHLSQYAQFLTDEAKQQPDLFHWDWHDRPHRGPGEYYANISFLDEQIGRIIGFLKSKNQLDNSIVIFSSDNGPVTREVRKPWELGMAGETGGLRGRKDNLFEGGIRVPGIIRYPSLIEGGAISNEPVTALDILPTLAEIIGFEVPSDRAIDGLSIAKTFSNKKLERKKPLIWTIDMPNQDDPVNEWAIRDGDWKLILTRDEIPKYLFNITDDPYEVDNQVNKRPEILAELLQQFEIYRQDIESDTILMMKQKSMQ